MKRAWTFLLCIAVIGAISFIVIQTTGKNEPNNINTGRNDLFTTKEAEKANDIRKKQIDVPTLCQYPELPTGCEATAATMVLQYYGVSVSAEEFAGTWLECNSSFYSENGKEYGPDPNKVFAGDPFSLYSYGCYARPIVNAINRNSTECSAEIISGRSLERLCKDYIDHEKPLLIWATMEMKESYEGRSWYLQNGPKFTWIAGEHCLVLVGYDSNHYYLNDPMTGSTISYPKALVEKRYAELGKQAILIERID